MKAKHKAKLKAREEMQERQAQKVIKGVFCALILLGALTIIGYYLL